MAAYIDVVFDMAYTTMCYKEIWASPKIRVFPPVMTAYGNIIKITLKKRAKT